MADDEKALTRAHLLAGHADILTSNGDEGFCCAVRHGRSPEMTQDLAMVTSGIDPKQKPTDRHVALAYRFFLGREPESQRVVDDALANVKDFVALCQRFMNSAEFRKRHDLRSAPTHKPLDWPAIHVDTDVAPAMLERMLRHIESNWQAMGETEPHFSVLTHPDYRADKIGGNIDTFYESGARSLSYFESAAARSGRSLDPHGRCFELGCGVGRVTLALATVFSRVIASDISQPHLDLARQEAEKRGKSNIDFVHLQDVADIYNIPKYDYFFSIIVLQHNPPPVIKALLQAILSRMKSGGLAYFQVPTYRQGYLFNAQQYLDGATSSGKMEVHVLPQPDIFALIRESNCEVLEIREDGWAGNPAYVSNSFLLSKKAS